MIRNSKTPALISPVLIDLALTEFQKLLLDNLPWLNRSYGAAELLRDTTTGKAIKKPAVYVGTNKGKEYEELFPDGHKYNFSFFKIEDGVDSDYSNPENTEYKAKFGLIVWFDFRKIYPTTWKQRTVQNVIKEVRDAIKSNILTASKVRLGKHWVEPENIYKGYSDVELNSRSLMRPFGGLKIEGIISFSELSLCSLPSEEVSEFTSEFENDFDT